MPHLLLKGVWHEIFSFKFFHESVLPVSLSIPLGPIQICSKIRTDFCEWMCAADFSLLNLPKGKSLGRSKPATSSYAQAPQHTVWDDSYCIQAFSELPSIEIK